MRCFLYRVLTEMIFLLGIWRSRVVSAWLVEGYDVRKVEKISREEVAKLASSGFFVECPNCCLFFKPELGRRWMREKGANGKAYKEEVIGKSKGSTILG